MTIQSTPGGTRSNWNGTAWTSSSQLVTPGTPRDLVTIVTDTARFPSPLRPIGEMHSMNDCFVTPSTLVSLRFLAHVGPVTTIAGRRTVTVGAGARLIDINRVLARQDLQLPVSPEIGNATAGSVACCGTKDSSLRGGPGQVSATVVGVKMVDPSGAVQDLNILARPGDLAALREVRSSYGLLGILFEVTFLVEPIRPVRFEYHELRIDPAAGVIPDLLTGVLAGADGFLGFLQPYSKHLLVERRTLVDERPGILDHLKLHARNFAWEHAGAFFANVAAQLPAHGAALHLFDELVGHSFENFLRGFTATRGDCMIDFGRHDPTFFDFTFWAFPASRWTEILRNYFAFCVEHEAREHFRPSLFTEIYYIHRDQVAEASLLSFAPADAADEHFFTLDVVDSLPAMATEADAQADPERRKWNAMNAAYSALAAQWGGIPLFNQTKQLTRDIVLQSPLANRWRAFSSRVRGQAGAQRLLNPFFDNLLV